MIIKNILKYAKTIFLQISKQKSYLASLENLCTAGGPARKAASAVSAKPNDGFWILLQSS